MDSLRANWDLATRHRATRTFWTVSSAVIWAMAWMRRRVFSRPALEPVKLVNWVEREGLAGGGIVVQVGS